MSKIDSSFKMKLKLEMREKILYLLGGSVTVTTHIKLIFLKYIRDCTNNNVKIFINTLRVVQPTNIKVIKKIIIICRRIFSFFFND